MHDLREWFEQRTHEYAQFVDPVALAGRKRELGLSVSVLLTCFRATKAVRTLIGDIHALNVWAPLTDQIAVITASSIHGMDAMRPGVEVDYGGELMPEYGPVIGKGDDMWKRFLLPTATWSCTSTWKRQHTSRTSSVGSLNRS